MLRPENTTLDAELDLSWAGDAISFGGELSVVGLSMQHDSLSAEAIENLSLGLSLRGSVHPLARRLVLDQAEARIRNLVGRVRGSVALPPGEFRFKNGNKLSVVPEIDLAFSVPRVSCAKLLASIPSAVVPRLKGFVLKGDFAADFGVKIDFRDLEALELRGKVGIDGCKVIKAPDDVLALAGPESLLLNVEVPKKLGAPATDPSPTSSRWSSVPTTRTSSRTRRSRRCWSGRS